MKEANIPANEIVEASLTALHRPLSNLQLENDKYMKNSVKTTIQIRSDVGFIDRFGDRVEFFRVYNTFNK